MDTLARKVQASLPANELTNHDTARPEKFRYKGLAYVS